MAGMLKIIAERAGLSQSTVSQILNRKANDFSSEETRQRVFALASELGYKQNFGHKLLRGDKTRTVGVLLGMHRITLEEHIQAMIIRLLDKLELRGYGAYLVTLSDSEEKNLQTVRDLVSRGVDCFIAIGDPVGGRKVEQEILKNKKTVVGYVTSFHRNIVQNLSASCEEIIRFFLREGRSNFRFFLGYPANSERLQGLKQIFPEVTEQELIERYYVNLGDLKEHDDIDTFAQISYEKTREALERDPSISGFFYLSDYFAVGGVQYLMETGRKVGTDVLVAGFNNIHAVRTHYLPISSAEHAIEEITEGLVGEMDKTGDLNRIVYSKTIIRKNK